MNNLRILFLSSGGGGNLKFVNEYIEEVYSLKVIGVIADRKCDALQYADKKNIFNKILSFDRSPESDRILINEISSLKPNLIITTIHKILSERFVEHFRNLLLNLHYSYLPAYKGTIGMKGVDLALQRKNTFIGTTVHHVANEVDSGDTVCQGIICVKGVDDITNRIFQLGALTLISAIMHEFLFEMLTKKCVEDFIISPFPKTLDYGICKNIFERIK